MNKTIIQDEVQGLLEAITEQAEALRSYKDKIPQIELDMLMENVRKLYENLHLLNRINDLFESLNRIPAPAPAVKMPEIHKEQPNAGEKSPVTIFFGNPSEKKTVPPVTEMVSEPAPADEFDFSVRLREARDRALGTGTRPERPSGLKNAISINDKFLFINELFDGNLKDYNENIEILNGFHDLKTAFEYLDLLRQKNRWETDGKGFRRLKEILEKIY